MGCFWTLRRISARIGLRTPNRPAGSESLYRLSYPSPHKLVRLSTVFQSLSDITCVPVLFCDIACRISQFYVIILRHLHTVRSSLRYSANSLRTPSTLATFTNGVELCVKSGTMIHCLDALFTLETIHMTMDNW